MDVDGDGENEFWQVESSTRVSVYGDYALRDLGPVESLRLRLGVSNVFDEAAPLADESLGYLPEYHSLKGREYYLQVRANF